MTDDWLTVLHGDCRAVLPTLPAQSVNCVVTSPPYLGLRDYGTATWDGGDPDCGHRQAGTHVGPKSTLRSDGRAHTGPYDGEKVVTEGFPFKDHCGKCGAVRQDSQIGLEATPADVAALVDVFREIRRVLRDDGVAWCNLGDSYLPNKQLAGVPWRVAFALQADGWYLRSDIIWSKPNPMPESVTDRPTKSHEYVFLLTKRSTYWYDADAVREPHARIWDPTAPNGSINARTRDAVGIEPNPYGRNLRSVWTVATQPYAGAHFATFPPKLVEPCILAGCPPQVCADCGAPWERVVERHDVNQRNERISTASAAGFAAGSGHSAGSSSDRVRHLDGKNYVHVRGVTTGWQPTCAHDDAETLPGVVLDPFAGTGTALLVANKLSRRAIGIDLSGEYLDQLATRNQQAPLGLVG